MYLILSTPSLEYAQAVSHELWMLARPRQYSANETSQFYCGSIAKPDGSQVAIGPIDGRQNVHRDADEHAFVDLIGSAITEGERLAIVNSINVAKGGQIQMLDVINATPSLAAGLITKQQLEGAGWFANADADE